MSDNSTMSAKFNLRKKLHFAINNLSENEIKRQSDIVTNKIISNNEFQKAKIVSVYLSMDKEIQTENLLIHIFKQGKECFIPRFQFGNTNMEMTRLTSIEQYHSLPRNKWNIKQFSNDEQSENVFDRGQLDLVLAPGLGFTKAGLRIGRGKGYYDRFFAKAKKELPEFPYLIGLAFTEQIVSEIPTDEFDFPLDLVVSPE